MKFIYQKIFLFLIFSFTLFHTACNDSKDFNEGSSYKTVEIGDQVWMAENLNVSRFRNGDLIPEAKSKEVWEKESKEKKPAWCHYDNNPANSKKNGKLYNWYAIIDSRGLAPVGWHVPSIEEWEKLFDNLGGKEIAGKKMKSFWGYKYFKGNGTNEIEFNGRPGGFRSTYMDFHGQGKYGCWWSNSNKYNNSGNEVGQCIGFGVYTLDEAFIAEDDLNGGLSVRCLRD